MAFPPREALGLRAGPLPTERAPSNIEGVLRGEDFDIPDNEIVLREEDFDIPDNEIIRLFLGLLTSLSLDAGLLAGLARFDGCCVADVVALSLLVRDGLTSLLLRGEVAVATTSGTAATRRRLRLSWTFFLFFRSALGVSEELVWLS